MTTIGFVTYGAEPALTTDDRVAADALERVGVSVRALPWDAAETDWSSHRLVILRSCWDYHKRLDEFSAWLGSTANRTVIQNPPDTVAWNMDKRYLVDLANRGVPVTPTVYLERGEHIGLETVMTGRNWPKAVVKPAVSATAFNTFVTDGRNTDEQRAFERLTRDGAVLVQPFREEIRRHGEWSFVYIDGVYSHAVLKRVRDGDFRVQSEFGGTVSTPQPPTAFVEQAGAMLDAAGVAPLYARVDAVPVDGSLELMELELVEPALFFTACEPAAERFAQAVLRRLTAASVP